jgi:iron(III) transport system substrate-binding protein
MSRFMVIIISTFIALGIVLVGCTAPSPTAAPAAKASATQLPATQAPAATTKPVDATSGTIVVYTALEDDQISTYLKPFIAKYPNIKVEIVRDSTGIITAKFLAEKENPKADVIWGLAATSLLLADQAKMLEAYAPAGLDKVKATFRDSKNPPAWVGIDAWFSAFCVNTVELKAKNLPMPTSWEDLTKPVYKGHIVMPNPNSSGTGFLSVNGILTLKGNDEGWKYLDALHNNISVYTHSGSKPCKMAGAGETVIGISFDYRAVKQKADGQPIEPVFPKEGAGWDIEANALVKKAAIKPAAKTFLDWAISPEAMKLYAASYPVTAVDTGVAIPSGYPSDPLSVLVKQDFNQAASGRDNILKEWMKRYDSKSEPK